ncbi:MAG: major facilitator superfamily 1 [Gammaproteobacteria bacterium]|jgi:MFS family permease|nr:major facilitator superfamily 1 [Gammaproteobacteria bacterium]
MQLIPESADANARRLLSAKALRSVADGYVSILLPAYLLGLGLGAFRVGVLTTATLLGSAALTLLTGFITATFGHRRPLLAASGLMIFTGVAFTLSHAFWPLLLIAFVGTLNPSSGDVSIFLPLEQSLLSQSVGDRDRTALFALYSLSGSLMAAFGTLLAGLPEIAAKWFGTSSLQAMQGMFLLYALIGLAAAMIYRRLLEPALVDPGMKRQPLGPSRGIVYRLATLFSIDAFGGGFLVQTILALWLLRAFHLSLATTATLFFCSNLLTAASYLAAPPIARRIGLINTMVFTHLPSSLCLIAIPFLSNLNIVVGLLMLRSLLSQMDVPTRSSYVMAVVTPPERPAAAGVTSVPRSLAAAISPTIAGYLISVSSFGWPLLIGGALKIAYDLTLLAMFRHVRPPEEAVQSDERSSQV